LPGLPNRIEGYDISSIQGAEQVGSMVVWENGDMKKDDYKRFRIKAVAGADDFASLAEMLRRRFARSLEEGGVLPDLVLIDGGRGQLNVGLTVLQELGLDWIPVVSLAKQREEVYRGDALEPLALDPTSPALHTLQKIRDEAHRFAVTYHKKLRTQRTIQSVLDAIPGVGPTIRTSLLKTLGSARRVRESSVAELAAVPKVTPRLAERIHDHFHPPAGEPAAAGGDLIEERPRGAGGGDRHDEAVRGGRGGGGGDVRDRPGRGGAVPAPDQAAERGHREGVGQGQAGPGQEADGRGPEAA
jgi:excinuclease ABC subunit C